MNERPTLAKQRLTDFFEGAGEAGKRETIMALFRGRRFVVALLWASCQSVIGLFLVVAHQQASLLNRAIGPAAISMILGAVCLGVLARDWLRARDLEGEGLEKAWLRARDRSVSRLAIFSISLVVGGAMAVLWTQRALVPAPF